MIIFAESIRRSEYSRLSLGRLQSNLLPLYPYFNGNQRAAQRISGLGIRAHTPELQYCPDPIREFRANCKYSPQCDPGRNRKSLPRILESTVVL